ncbi:transcriptional regulator [Solibacillus sp. FSL H8-0523]|uniref:transcriptional regulator n=1 Tax=Solibacillus sp. FSL H8-0523 TaxID=2954511 RepID=UPI00310191E0
MIEFERFIPFYTTIKDNKLILYFAYKYLSIKKDGCVFEFIPSEDNRIVVCLATKAIVNVSDMFAFKKGQQTIKLPLYQLMLVSNMRTHLLPIIEETREKMEAKTKGEKIFMQIPKATREEAVELIRELEEDNIARLLEKSLMNNDKVLFEQVVKLKK